MAQLRIRIQDAGQHVGEAVEIAGWLYNLRKSGKIVFPLLRDGTGIMQCVAVKANIEEALFETLKNLTQESSLILTGTIREEQRAPGGYEMDVEGAEIMQRLAEPDPYPIMSKEHGADFLMDHRHLWLRSKRQHAVIRVRGRHDIIRSGLLRRRKGLSNPIRPALQRRRRHGFRQSVLLRAHFPRLRVEDAQASHGILDG